jgi:hypothetical protein
MNKLYKLKIKLYDKKSIPICQPPPPPIIYEHFEYQPISIEVMKADSPYKCYEFTNRIVKLYLSLLEEWGFEND